MRLAIFLLLSLAACEAATSVDRPVTGGMDVLAYEAALVLDPATRALEGEVTVTLARADTLAALPLAAAGLEIEAVSVDGEPLAVDAVRAPGGLVVPLPAGRDTSRVRVRYRGVPSEGLYEAEHEGLRVVYTDSWPDRGRGWLPGFHLPSDPATFALRLDVPAGYEAVASGELEEVDTLASGAVRYRWTLDTPAPTYTFAFAVSDFSVTRATAGDGLPIHYYMLAPDSAEVVELARTPAMISTFERLVGPYPYDQYASVEIPFDFGGMENASAAFLQARLFELDAAEEVQAHEAAHQWFGNRVVIADWRDLWLSEGFATYLTTLFYEQVDGLEAARREWVEMVDVTPVQMARHGPLVPSGPVDPNEHLTWIPYLKGGSVLHLLRLRIGDEAFFQALRTAYARYAGRPFSTEDFHALLEEASGEDLEAFFDYWVYGEELPVLVSEWDAGTQTLTWEIEGGGGTLDGLPVELAVEHAGQTRYVRADERSITLPPGGAGVPTVRPVGVLMRLAN